jgi:CRP-like cAMP-binding protein
MTGTPLSLEALFSMIPCFDALAPDQRRELEQLCSVQRYEPEQAVFRYGDAGDALYLVADGAICVFTHNNAGQEIVLETTGIGAVLGEVALFSEEARTANAKAVGAATLLRIGRPDVSRALALCPALTEMLLTGMARRLRTSGDKLRHLTTFDINAMKREQITPFDKLCEAVVSVLAGVPFLVAMTVGCVWWIAARPFRDSQLDYLSLAVGLLGFLVTLLVLLNQRREEKSAAVADAEESFAIRQAARELQYLHEKLDAVLSRKG